MPLFTRSERKEIISIIQEAIDNKMIVVWELHKSTNHREPQQPQIPMQEQKNKER